MARIAWWELFEVEYLDALDIGATFTSRDVAAWFDTTNREGSYFIQYYLRAQRSPKCRTRYLLHRNARTTAAVWTLGSRSQDARALTGQFGLDVKHRLLEAIRPDLTRLAEQNPRARRALEDIDGLLDGVAKVLTGVIAAVGWTDDEADG